MLSVLYFMKTSSRSSHNKYIAEVCDYRINYNIINLPLSMISKTAASNYPPRSKAKQGDWICLKCSNYNYSFRTKCIPSLMQVTDASSKINVLISTSSASSELRITENSPSPACCFCRLIAMEER